MSIFKEEPTILAGFDAPEFLARGYGKHLIWIDRIPGEYSKNSWSEYCRSAGEWKKQRGRILILVAAVHTRGPNAAQRKEYQNATNLDSNDRIAVLSDNALTRAVVQVFSTFLSVPTKFFAPSDLKGAADFIGLEASPQAIQGVLDDMRKTSHKA